MKLIIDLRPDGPLLSSDDIPFLVERGASPVQVGAAIKFAARGEVLRVAQAYRNQITSASGAKLAAYRIKEAIARNPDIAAPNEIALIEREAVARGVSRDVLIADILKQADAYRHIALLVEVIEAETCAAIVGIPDGAADIEAQVHDALEAGKLVAKATFQEALAILSAAG